MTIRPYTPTDRKACLDIFDSNCPKFFAPHERVYLEDWLNAQDARVIAYSNSAADHFYVLEEDGEILACGGFYLAKGENRISMAWGMVHNHAHRKGYGRALFIYRLEEAKKLYPGAKVTMNTSQHTYPFYEKMGLSVTSIKKDGYATGLDRYEMEALQ